MTCVVKPHFTKSERKRGRQKNKKGDYVCLVLFETPTHTQHAYFKVSMRREVSVITELQTNFDYSLELIFN